jgi:hypothetical protein
VFAIGQDTTLKNLINGCAEKYSHDYSFTQFTRESSANFYGEKFKSNKLKNAYSWIFASKKYIAKNERIRFDITAYRYDLKNTALNKFKEIKEESKLTMGETIFDKDWNYTLVAKNYILIIRGSCSYDINRWTKIRLIFEKEIEKSIGKIEGSISCSCGGGPPDIR